MDADVRPQILYVQKIVNRDVLRLARAVKVAGGRVFYDIDDAGEAGLAGMIADDATFRELMQLVSVVTVDTEVRRQVMQRDPRLVGVPEIWVIPDPIDYIDGDIPTVTRPPVILGRKLHGCWFGNAPNMAPAAPYLQVLTNSPDVADISVITNASHVDSTKTQFPKLLVSAWSLETFPQTLSCMDFCVLIHDTSIEGLQKSNNKMLAALAYGVVPFVSRTPAYAETAGQMRIPEIVIDDVQDILDLLRPEKFLEILQKMSEDHFFHELQKFSPSASALLFSEKLTQHLVNRQIAAQAPSYVFY